MCVQVHRGVESVLSVYAEASSWFHCVATNKLGTAKGQAEFYVTGSACVRACVCVCAHCGLSLALKELVVQWPFSV